jgi:cyclic pyranopterin phosphate synthase
LPLTRAAVDFEPDTTLPGVRIRATVRTLGNTGVEMEALSAATVAALTIYDMLKAAEKGMRIEGIHLALKEGGNSGRYVAQDPEGAP